jgi:hypothetical protein
MFAVPLLALVAALSSVPSAEAKALKITEVVASSEHFDGDETYEGKNLKDGRVSTVWVEGVQGSGLGEHIELALDGSQTVTSLRVWNGNWYTADYWTRHNRIKEIDVIFSDGSKTTLVLEDAMEAQTIRLPNKVKTSSVKLKIKSTYGGSTFDDTCLSEVQVLNDEPDGFVTAATYETSSTYPADGDGNYEPKNMEDGVLDSMWCEGNKEGDGTGEWVQFNFQGVERIQSLSLNNGNAHSFSANMKANKATRLTLTFSDGSTEKIVLRKSYLTQSFRFAPRTTTSVRVSFDEIAKGTSFNDLCMSELRFQE